LERLRLCHQSRPIGWRKKVHVQIHRNCDLARRQGGGCGGAGRVIGKTSHYAAMKVAIELKEFGLSLEREVDPSGFCCEDLYACEVREACECGHFADELLSVHGSLMDYDGSLEMPNV